MQWGAHLRKEQNEKISMRRVGLCQVYTAKYPITIENVIISMREINRTLRLCSFQYSFLFLESESEREKERAREGEREREREREREKAFVYASSEHY